MIHVLVQCKVSDFPKWKESFDRLFSARQRAGEMTHRVFHNDDQEGELVMFFEWESKKDAHSFFASEEWTSAMRQGGVKVPPKPVYLDEVRALHLSPAD